MRANEPHQGDSIMDNAQKIKPQETPRDLRFNPPGQVKTINGSVASTYTMGSLALILATLREDGKMECPVYELLKRKWPQPTADGKAWFHSSIGWKLGQTRECFLQS